jgi:hypothetical protein
MYAAYHKFQFLEVCFVTWLGHPPALSEAGEPLISGDLLVFYVVYFLYSFIHVRTLLFCRPWYFRDICVAFHSTDHLVRHSNASRHIRDSCWQTWRCFTLSISGFRSVLRGSQVPRDHFPVDPCLRFCNG